MSKNKSKSPDIPEVKITLECEIIRSSKKFDNVSDTLLWVREMLYMLRNAKGEQTCSESK